MMLDELLDQSIPGGCPDCGAIQRLTTDGTGVYMLEVRHDDSCPYFGRVTR